MERNAKTSVESGGIRALLSSARDRQIVTTSVKVALVVGTILNLVNQTEPVLNGQGVNWVQFFLNYVVPFCVSSYSGATNQIRNRC